MVFDSDAAPKSRKEFMEWFDEQTEWSEGHSYEDYNVSTEKLQSFYLEMIKHFPPMNGPQAAEDYDDPKVTDHCIGRHVVYSAFAWSVADEAHAKIRELAIKHAVGFFDVNTDNGEILFLKETNSSSTKKPWWKFW